jgi:hypothetical protein
MVRQFDIRDISLLYRLAARGSALSYEPYVLNGINPLRNALSLLTRRAVPIIGANQLFVVQHEPDGLGMVELAQSGEALAGVVMYVAPTPARAENPDVWPALIEGLVARAGEHGARMLVAEADESRIEYDTLLRSGFAPVVSQVILKRNSPAEAGVKLEYPGLRRQSEKDDLHIKLLAARVMPRNLSAFSAHADITRLMHETRVGHLVMEDMQPTAHVSFNFGRRSHVMRLMFATGSEATERAPEVLSAALNDMGDAAPKPIYCVLPAYQGWLQKHLEALDFHAVASRVAMIKNIAATVRKPVWQEAAIPALSGLVKTKIEQ